MKYPCAAGRRRCCCCRCLCHTQAQKASEILKNFVIIDQEQLFGKPPLALITTDTHTAIRIYNCVEAIEVRPLQLQQQ